MLTTARVFAAILLAVALARAQDETESPAVDSSRAFGISPGEIRELVTRQHFVSSCQYGIMKTMKMYEDARNQCQRRISGRIAVIRNEQENAVVNELFIATYGHGLDNQFLKSNPSNFLWIGLSRDNEDSEWKWDDESIAVNYTNWKKGHPKSGNYVKMNRQGYWETTTNLMHHPSACERSTKYVVFKKRLDYETAGDVCSSMNMQFATIKSEEENNDLVAEAKMSLGSPYLDKNFEHVNQVWVGGYEDEDGSVMWEDGTAAEDYQNFEPTYGKAFSGAGDAKISVNKMQQFWKLEKGTEERSFACQCPNPGHDNFMDTETDDGLYNPEEAEAVYDDMSCKRRFYPDSRQMRYEMARLECRKKGRALAKIESDAENSHVVSLMNNLYRGRFGARLFDPNNWFWIGASDVLLEGTFTWEDGSPVNYTNWGKSQPDNAHPFRGGQNHISVYRGTKMWDDAHDMKVRPFVCYDENVSFEEELNNDCDTASVDDYETGTEIIDETVDDIDNEDTTSDNDRPMIQEVFSGAADCIKREYRGMYFISSQTQSYTDASRDCQERGMQLVSIHDEASNARIRSLVLNRVPVSGYVLATLGELSYFWVGLEVEGDRMSWVGGNHTTYENFANFYKRTGYSDTKDKLAVSKIDGSWEWRDSTERHMYVCEETDKWTCLAQRTLGEGEQACVGGMYEEVTDYSYNLDFLSWEGAKEACEEDGRILAFPTNIYENEQLRKFADHQYPRPGSVRSNPGEAENWIWLNLNDIDNEGEYVMESGEEAKWYHWGTNQPDNKFPRRGGQDRVTLNKNTGKWFDAFAERRLQSVCQKQVWQCVKKVLTASMAPTTAPASTEPAPPPEFLERPSSYIANIGSTVTFTARFDQSLGGYLRWVVDGKAVRASSSDNRIYQNEEGDLVIQDIVPSDEGVVSCVLFRGPREAIANAALRIVEEKLLSYIMITEGGESFEEAREVCGELGGSLACPENDRENVNVMSMVRDSQVWLGFTQLNGTLVLHDGSPADYANWAADQPASAAAPVMMDAREDSPSFGMWYTQDASERYAIVCERVPRKIKSSEETL